MSELLLWHLQSHGHTELRPKATLKLMGRLPVISGGFGGGLMVIKCSARDLCYTGASVCPVQINKSVIFTSCCESLKLKVNLRSD